MPKYKKILLILIILVLVIMAMSLVVSYDFYSKYLAAEAKHREIENSLYSMYYLQTGRYPEPGPEGREVLGSSQEYQESLEELDSLRGLSFFPEWALPFSGALLSLFVGVFFWNGVGSTRKVVIVMTFIILFVLLAEAFWFGNTCGGGFVCIGPIGVWFLTVAVALPVNAIALFILRRKHKSLA